jgi:hypothetical protein
VGRTKGDLVKIRILVVAAAALVAVAGCDSGGGTTVGSALPTSASAAAPTGGAATTAASSTVPTGSGPTGSSPTGSGPTGGGASPVGTRCHTSQLTASFKPGQPGAGQRYATLQLTNRSQQTCTVFGYGGLQPLDAAKKQLPITLVRDPGHAPTPVRLAPGASVGRTIHWTVVQSGESSCPTPAYASIIPPDETDPLVVAWPLGDICGGRMDGVPYGVVL